MVRKINRRKVVKIGGILLLIVAIFNPISWYIISQIPGNVVLKPTLSKTDRGNGILQELTVKDFCDPLPCANTYVVMTSTSQLDKDFHYCNFAKISGNVHIMDKTFNTLPRFGSNTHCTETSTSATQKYTCSQGSELTTYTFYKLFPFPQKIESEYFSCSEITSESSS